MEVARGILSHITKCEVGGIVVLDPSIPIGCLELDLRNRIVSALANNVEEATASIRIDKDEDRKVPAIWWQEVDGDCCRTVAWYRSR